MQVIGVCRFSYLGHGGFQVEHDTLAARSDFLFAPERMALRFAFFETICLPSIRAQTDPDFTFLIVIAEAMPQSFVERLRALVEDIPQVVIEVHPPGPHRRVISRAVEAQRLHDARPCLQFRLDDDDAVSIHFVARLRQVAAAAQGLLEPDGHLAVDFNKGYVLAPRADAVYAAAIQESCWSPALALMKRADSGKTILSFAHHRIWRAMPTVTLPDDAMMIRGIHAMNDSRQKPGIRPLDLRVISQKDAACIKTSFAIDVDRLPERFSAAP